MPSLKPLLINRDEGEYWLAAQVSGESGLPFVLTADEWLEARLGGHACVLASAGGMDGFEAAWDGRGEEHRDHAANARWAIEGAQGSEPHACREADDLAHALHARADSRGRDTMKHCAFQGAT